MRNIVLALLLGWIIAWLEWGWLPWLGMLLLLLALCFWLGPRQWRLMLMLFMLTLVMKVYAMQQQQRQLPMYLHAQQALLSACYEVLDGQRFPLSLKVSSISLSSPAIGESVTEASYWRPQQRLNHGYFTLTIYDKQAIASLQAQPQGHLQALVQTRQLRNYGNPEGFDYLAWSRRQGQLARGYIKQLLSLSQPAQVCTGTFDSLGALRRNLLQHIQNLAIDESAKKLWLALALGHSQALSGLDWQVVNRTGTTHLLIISGLHIGLLASLVLLIWKCLQPYFKVDYWHPVPLLVAWLIAFMYALFSGWGLPAQRAMIMLSFVIIGGWRRIAWPLEQRLLWAASLTLVLQPQSLYQAGFWFSYLAVANLALVWRQRPDSLRLQHWWRANWLSQVSLIALLTPILGWQTGGLSLLAPLINLLLIPLFTLLVVPWVLLMSLLSLVLDSHHPMFSFTGEGLAFIWQCLARVAAMDWAYLDTSHWHWSVWLIWLLVGVSVLLTARVIWVPVLALVLISLFRHEPSANKLTVLDVGQGLAVWLQAGEQHLLYDLGDRFRSGFNLTEAVILPALRAVGVDHLGKVYVSHWDRDHSGGISALKAQQAMSVGQWILPSSRRPKFEQMLGLNELPKAPCVTTSWQPFGSMNIRQFNLLGKGFDNNNASCVVQIEYAGKRLLLTGDIERLAEQHLWRSYASQLASDVLLAPHHGSQTSSSALFLTFVQPRISIISAGFDNRFKHPHDQVLQRYWQQDVYWLNTAIHGQIGVSMDNRQWRLNTYGYD